MCVYIYLSNIHTNCLCSAFLCLINSLAILALILMNFHENKFAFSSISERCDDTGRWNPTSYKTSLCLSCLHDHRNYCWRLGDDKGGQDINSHSIYLFLPRYSGFSTRGVYSSSTYMSALLWVTVWCLYSSYSCGPFYWHGLTLIPAWISNYIHYQVWG